MNGENGSKFRQIIPVTIGSLIGLSFGTMLGWASATFPLLVDPEISPILITWDQTPTVAAFLMEGNIVGTAFSSVTFLNSKIGVLLSAACQIAGWTAMHFVNDIFGLAASRILIGFGNGFGSGQLRIYAQESCEPEIFQLLMKYVPLSVNLGVIFTYIVGGLVSFRTLPLICVAIPVVNLVLFGLIPKHIYKSAPINRLETIENIYQRKLSADPATASNPGSATKNYKSKQLGIIQAVKSSKVRNGMILLFFIIFIPQYTGGTANVNYAQVVHIRASNPYPQLCSVIYGVVFLFSTLIAIQYANRFPRKPMLVVSCLICSLLLCGVCLNFYFLEELLQVSSAFSWGPLLLLCLFNLFHTTGVNTIPMLLITDKFPENARIIASKFYIMYFSLSAIFSTKIFQVLFTTFDMYMTYVFLSSFGFISAVLALVFLKESKPGKVASSAEGYCNNVVDLRDETVPPSTNKNNNVELQE